MEGRKRFEFARGVWCGGNGSNHQVKATGAAGKKARMQQRAKYKSMVYSTCAAATKTGMGGDLDAWDMGFGPLMGIKNPMSRGGIGQASKWKRKYRLQGSTSAVKEGEATLLRLPIRTTRGSPSLAPEKAPLGSNPWRLGSIGSK